MDFYTVSVIWGLSYIAEQWFSSSSDIKEAITTLKVWDIYNGGSCLPSGWYPARFNITVHCSSEVYVALLSLFVYSHNKTAIHFFYSPIPHNITSVQKQKNILERAH
ncbi:hypothetical protein AB205_0176600 [Aquarana catesbeiana]|uniref:Uncharacterized protein n=1 Tax=Aquarana catesbeiana TaxID=8400 RepID=A0A2G9SER0_AQUCT|nr:hypothetical protein AB205_0176600 [Aquarana catesbeiana]